MAGWIDSYRKWHQVVVEHYGSLDAFSDARTVRIMLGAAEREAKELDAFFDSISGRGMDDDPIVQGIREDHLAATNARNEMLQWLENKNLPR